MNPAMRPDSVQPLLQPASGDALSLFTYEPEGSSLVPAPPKAPGAVSLDRIVDAPRCAVEGIAVVQALSTAIREKGGINAGMLDLRGVFINEGGDLVALTPPGAEPAAPGAGPALTPARPRGSNATRCTAFHRPLDERHFDGSRGVCLGDRSTCPSQWT